MKFSSGRLPVRSAQRGVSLIVVLISLLIMSFAAVALLRSTDTATLIAGNLTFKKTALASGDSGTETAITWLTGNLIGTTLHADRVADGYYSRSAETCDLTGQGTPDDDTDDVEWDGGAANANCPMVAVTVAPAGAEAGYTISYVINRVCNAAGDPGSVVAADGVTPMICSRQTNADSSSSTRAGGAYGSMPLSGVPQTYYRITTRVTGPRNTVRYVQAFVVA
jgi:type IV pilus assembly protein PilX